MNFETKDSGVREEFASGMKRDTQEGKPRFDLIVPADVPYEKTMLTRWAKLLERGAKKYGDRNWEKANSVDELNRARASAFRHFMQWYHGELDEDHAAAVFFNIQEAEVVRERTGWKELGVVAGFDGSTGGARVWVAPVGTPPPPVKVDTEKYPNRYLMGDSKRNVSPERIRAVAEKQARDSTNLERTVPVVVATEDVDKDETVDLGGMYAVTYDSPEFPFPPVKKEDRDLVTDLQATIKWRKDTNRIITDGCLICDDRKRRGEPPLAVLRDAINHKALRFTQYPKNVQS